MAELGIGVEGFDVRFEAFLKGAQEHINKYYDAHYKNSTAVVPPTLTYQVGPKYIRIVKQERNQSGGSLYCFVDRTNGNILKGSWKSPVKNGVRGSIYADDYGLDRVNWHGTVYLR